MSFGIFVLIFDQKVQFPSRKKNYIRFHQLSDEIPFLGRFLVENPAFVQAISWSFSGNESNHVARIIMDFPELFHNTNNNSNNFSLLSESFHNIWQYVDILQESKQNQTETLATHAQQINEDFLMKPLPVFKDPKTKNQNNNGILPANVGVGIHGRRPRRQQPQQQQSGSDNDENETDTKKQASSSSSTTTELEKLKQLQQEYQKQYRLPVWMKKISFQVQKYVLEKIKKVVSVREYIRYSAEYSGWFVLCTAAATTTYYSASFLKTKLSVSSSDNDITNNFSQKCSSGNYSLLDIIAKPFTPESYGGTKDMNLLSSSSLSNTSSCPATIEAQKAATDLLDLQPCSLSPLGFKLKQEAASWGSMFTKSYWRILAEKICGSFSLSHFPNVDETTKAVNRKWLDDHYILKYALGGLLAVLLPGAVIGEIYGSSEFGIGTVHELTPVYSFWKRIVPQLSLHYVDSIFLIGALRAGGSFVGTLWGPFLFIFSSMIKRWCYFIIGWIKFEEVSMLAAVSAMSLEFLEGCQYLSRSLVVLWITTRGFDFDQIGEETYLRCCFVAAFEAIIFPSVDEALQKQGWNFAFRTLVLRVAVTNTVAYFIRYLIRYKLRFILHRGYDSCRRTYKSIETQTVNYFSSKKKKE